MKTITCKQMGGECDVAMTASTPEELVGKAMQHVQESHPEMAAKIEKMSDAETKTWMDNFVANIWAKTPDAPVAAA